MVVSDYDGNVVLPVQAAKLQSPQVAEKTSRGRAMRLDHTFFNPAPQSLRSTDTNTSSCHIPIRPPPRGKDHAELRATKPIPYPKGEEV